MKKERKMGDLIEERAIPIPEGVTVEVHGREVKVKGPKGSLSENLSHLPVEISIREGNVVVSAKWPKKRETAKAGTAAAHVRNMVKGVTKGFKCKLKVVYAHFPITVKVNEKQKKVLIENFIGERTSRVATMVGEVKVKVSGDELTVEGISIQDVTQTAANIEASTKIKEKDQRVFLDGIFVFERSEGI